MTIAQNRKAFHEYFIEDRFEAGLMLEGWEVKALRAKHISLQEAYVILKDGAFYLFGAHITPLAMASTHVAKDPTRTRKLLLNKKEIEKLVGKITRAGYTVMPLNMHFKNGRIKLEIGLAKGKKQHDKRAVDKERDVKREVDQAMKGNRGD
jgi:SsrA-binding protein